MTALVFADVHGSHASVERILGSTDDYDVVIVGGDLTTNGTGVEAHEALERYRAFERPVFMVPGNMDPAVVEDALARGGVSIDGRGILVGAVGFFGVGATPYSPLHTPNEISEEETLRRAEAGWSEVRGARWKVLVAHTPPFDTALDRIHSGKHVGSTAVRQFIEQRAPDVVLCGHIHESRGQERLGPTLVVNCGPAIRGYYVRLTVGRDIAVELCG